jgi:hypothetical protein
MRRVLFVALVVIVLVTGLPVLMGMGGMATCADCGQGLLLPMTCVAVLAGAVVLLPALLRSRLRRRDRSLRLALFAAVFERPPQLV